MSRKQLLFWGMLLGGLGLFNRWLKRQRPTPIKNKVVIITGASAGIGEAAAHVFASKGARVVLVARRQEKLDIVARELQQRYKAVPLIIPADVTQEDDLQRVVTVTMDTFKRIDVLVNNAGLAMGSYLHEQDPAAVRRMFEVNLLSLVRLTQLVLPVMWAQHSGHIVNVSSVAGCILAPGETTYVATKAGLNGFTDSLRRELIGTGINVSLVMPGWTKTGMVAHMDQGTMRKGSLLNPLITVDDALTVADRIVDAVRYNLRDVLMGGPQMVIGAWSQRWSPLLMDIYFRHFVNREQMVEGFKDLGTS